MINWLRNQFKSGPPAWFVVFHGVATGLITWFTIPNIVPLMVWFGFTVILAAISIARD